METKIKFPPNPKSKLIDQVCEVLSIFWEEKHIQMHFNNLLKTGFIIVISTGSLVTNWYFIRCIRISVRGLVVNGIGQLPF